MKKDQTAYTPSGASALRQELRNAMADYTRTAMRVCHGLFDVYYGTTKDEKGPEIPLIQAWGHESFEDYVEVELGIHHGTAKLYVVTYDELCIRRNFPEGTLPNSITKLKLLAKISRHLADGREMNRWVSRAIEMGCCELEAAMEEEFGGGAVRKKNVGFHVKWNKVEPLMTAIRSAKETFGVQSNSEALIHIVEEWAQAQKAKRLRAAG